MTIRRRFSLSFLGIIGLFAFNAGVYVWSNQRRSVAVEELRRAISRQSLLSSVQLTLNDTEKQISLLSQATLGVDTDGASAAEKTQFGSRLSLAESNVEAFRKMSDPKSGAVEFEKSFRQLTASWRIFYNTFGVNQSTAVTELVIHAEPLSRTVIHEMLPMLQAEENTRAELAGENFRSASRIGDRVTFAIYLVSTLLAMTLAYVVSRDITQALTALKTGAEAIGSGDLGHRISLQRDDELGQLGKAFDNMSSHLDTARQELTQAHEEQKRKSEDLAQALERLGKAQDQLVVQQKLASLGTLTAGIAHEIKNPLNFVNNFAEISMSLVDDIRAAIRSQRQGIDPKELDFIEETLGDLSLNASKIREHGQRADGIVAGMLMHSRGQSGKAQPTNLNALVAEYVKLAYHGLRAQDIDFNVTIEESYDPAIPSLNLVPHDLSRVILNLANNACYSADQKARRSANGFRPTLKVTTAKLRDGVEIRIRDNGNGIPKDIQEKIFEPFFTTKPAGSGTGLGLSMTYEIVVQEHKGSLRVESEPGEYAEFIVTLPGK